MKITLIQTELFWEEKIQNRNHFTELIDEINESTDLIMLPEMFSTGFSMNAKILAESMNGEIVNWMRETAKKKKSAICGSLIIEENKKYFNRFVWVDEQENIFTYDKRHLFRMGEETGNYSQGTKKIIIEYKGWKIFPVICYDLRFPVWSRRTKKFDYDLMLVVANWPERRNLAWKVLLQARAMENQCYVAAVNRIGNDGNKMYHSGDSSFINPKGEIIFRESDKPFSKTFIADLNVANELRIQFPVIEDADSFSLE